MKREEEKEPTRLESLNALGADFASFVYRKNEDGSTVVLGRTGISWGKFYVKLPEIVGDIALAQTRKPN